MATVFVGLTVLVAPARAQNRSADGSSEPDSEASATDTDTAEAAETTQALVIFDEARFPADAEVTHVLVRCDGQSCDDPDLADSLLALTELQNATRVTREQALRAARRMARLGFFSIINLYFLDDGDGQALVFDGQLIDIIRSIRIRSRFALADEIRRRLFLRGGQPWTGDPALLTRQVSTVQEYFRDDGFFDSEVSISPEPVNTHEYDLQVVVRRRNRRSLGRIYLRGQEALPYSLLRDTVAGEFNLMRTFTSERFGRAQDAMLEEYRDVGYLQARLVFDDVRFNADRTVDLFIQVREGVRWRVEFRGNRLISDRRLRDSLNFVETGFIDTEEIRIAAAAIKARYETTGHYFAQVRTTLSELPDGSQNLVFDINEGVGSEIRSISFSGIEADVEQLIRPLLITSEYDLVAVGGYLQRAVLDQDVASIESALEQQGYLQSRVSRVTIVGEDGGRDLNVRFHIDIGPRTVVGNLLIDELAELSNADIPALSTREAEPFDAQAFQQDLAVLQELYRQRGFPTASVTGSCVDGSGNTVECEAPRWPPECRWTIARDTELSCTQTNRAGNTVEECILVRPSPECVPTGGVQSETVDLRVHSEPGGFATLGQVFFRGNFRTRTRILRRELPFDTGDPFVFSELLQGQSSIRSLRIFDSVRVQTIWNEPEGTPDNVAHVLVQVEENRTRFLEHRIALESRVTPQSDVLFIFSNEPSFRNVNFLGRAEELRLVANFDIDLLSPERIRDDEFRTGLSLVYIDPRMYFGRLLSDPWELRAEAAFRYDLLAVAPAPLRRTLESSVTVREEFDAVRGLFLEGGLSIRRTSVLDQSDPLVVATEFEPALILSLTPRITIERRDNPLNPTRGWFSQIQLEVADDFIGVLNSARFTKLTTRASGYIPLGAGFVGGANIRFGMAVGGVSQGFRSPSRFALPLSERFALGGVTSLRGFAQGQVTSIATDEFGGDVVAGGNLELRYPFAPDWGVYGATFLDVGQIARDPSELSINQMRLTTGFGLRILIAELLPVLIDYGAVLDRRPGEPFGRLHFNIGYTF
jgi:outer membrane protein insertion porin family